MSNSNYRVANATSPFYQGKVLQLPTGFAFTPEDVTREFQAVTGSLFYFTKVYPYGANMKRYWSSSMTVVLREEDVIVEVPPVEEPPVEEPPVVE